MFWLCCRPSYPDYDPESCEGAEGGSAEPMEQDGEEEEEDVELDVLDGDNFQLVLPSGEHIIHSCHYHVYRNKNRKRSKYA